MKCQVSPYIIYNIHVLETSICEISGISVQELLQMLTSYSTMRLLARSALFPDRAITMLGLACRWSSFTHDLARLNVSYNTHILGHSHSWRVLMTPHLSKDIRWQYSCCFQTPGPVRTLGVMSITHPYGSFTEQGRKHAWQNLQILGGFLRVCVVTYSGLINLVFHVQDTYHYS